VLELHLRCWAGPRPVPRDAALLARARRMAPDDPVRYPAAPDLFAHLAVHALREGRLDCGPLALLDLAMLVERETLDWPTLLDEARAEGWLPHAALLLTLADRWTVPGLLERTGCALAVPSEVVAQAERLLAQDMATCREAQFYADLGEAARGAGLLRTVWRKLAGRSAAAGAPMPAARDFAAEGGYWRWLGNRARRMIAAGLAGSVRRQAAG
jgi:hypothetical protein